MSILNRVRGKPAQAPSSSDPNQSHSYTPQEPSPEMLELQLPPIGNLEIPPGSDPLIYQMAEIHKTLHLIVHLLLNKHDKAE